MGAEEVRITCQHALQRSYYISEQHAHYPSKKRSLVGMIRSDIEHIRLLHYAFKDKKPILFRMGFSVHQYTT